MNHSAKIKAFCFFQYFLHTLWRGKGYPPSTVIDKLKELKLFRIKGRRAGHHLQWHVTMMTDMRREMLPANCKPCSHVEVLVFGMTSSRCLSNVICLCKKLDEIITSMKTIHQQIVAITEPWQMQFELCSVEGYSVFSPPQRGQEGWRGTRVVSKCSPPSTAQCQCS